MGSSLLTNLGDNGWIVQKQVKSTIIQLSVFNSEYTSLHNSTGQPSISTGTRSDSVAQQWLGSRFSNLKTCVVKNFPYIVTPKVSNEHFPFERINGIVSYPNLSQMKRKPSKFSFCCSSSSCSMSWQIHCPHRLLSMFSLLPLPSNTYLILNYSILTRWYRLLSPWKEGFIQMSV